MRIVSDLNAMSTHISRVNIIMWRLYEEILIVIDLKSSFVATIIEKSGNYWGKTVKFIHCVKIVTFWMREIIRLTSWLACHWNFNLLKPFIYFHPYVLIRINFPTLTLLFSVIIWTLSSHSTVCPLFILFFHVNFHPKSIL